MGRGYSCLALVAAFIFLTSVLNIHLTAENVTYVRHPYGVLMCSEFSNRLQNKTAKVSFDGLTCNITVQVNSSVKMCFKTKKKLVRCVHVMERQVQRELLSDTDTPSTEEHLDLDPSTEGPSQTPVNRSTAAVRTRLNICDTNSSISDSCNASWTMILEARKTGKILKGSRNSLLSCVSQGRRLKVYVHGFKTAYEIFATKVVLKTDQPNKDDTKDRHICGQTGMQLMPKYKNYTQTATFTLCTTGDVTRQLIVYKKNGMPKLIKLRAKKHTTWFAFLPKRKTVSLSYAYDRNGKLKKKSDCTFSNLKDNILKGAGITIVTPDGTTSIPGQSVYVGRKVISATYMRTFQTSQNSSITTKYLTQMINVFESTGSIKTVYQLFWSKKTKSVRLSSGNSFVLDRCWKQVHEFPKHKSTKSLKYYIKRGHRIKLLISSPMTRVEEAQVVFFKGKSTVHGQLLYNMAGKAGAIIHNWQLASSNSVTSSFYFFEQNRLPYTSTNKHKAKWFVDTTPWLLVFHRAIDGSIISGSLATLRSAVRKGSQVRVGCQFSTHFSQYSSAEKIHIDKSGKVHANLNAYLKSVEVNTSFPTLYCFDLDPHPVWQHMIVSSDGTIDIVYITNAQNHYTRFNPIKVETKWFIQP